VVSLAIDVHQTNLTTQWGEFDMNHNFAPSIRRVSHILRFCVGVLLLAACVAQPAAESSQGAMKITLLPGEGDTLTVQLADSAGQPITDATVSLEGNMNHAGMAPVLADGVSDDADGAADGAYQIPFKFTMMGDWIVTVHVERPDGSKSTQDVEMTFMDGKAQVKG